MLQYCLDVIKQRQMDDPDYSWLWKLKARVATGALATLLDHIGIKTVRSEQELTEEEKKVILHTHPLLDNSRIPSPSPSPREHSEWFQAMKQKVEKYVTTLEKETA